MSGLSEIPLLGIVTDSSSQITAEIVERFDVEVIPMTVTIDGVDYAEGVDEDDRVYESHGIKIVVDSASLPVLDGTTVDFVRENVLNEGFEFINPNIKDMCGCGESFSVRYSNR